MSELALGTYYGSPRMQSRCMSGSKFSGIIQRSKMIQGEERSG